MKVLGSHGLELSKRQFGDVFLSMIILLFHPKDWWPSCATSPWVPWICEGLRWPMATNGWKLFGITYCLVGKISPSIFLFQGQLAKWVCDMCFCVFFSSGVGKGGNSVGEVGQNGGVYWSTRWAWIDRDIGYPNWLFFFGAPDSWCKFRSTHLGPCYQMRIWACAWNHQVPTLRSANVIKVSIN